MNKRIATYVRGSFALFLLGMGLYAGLDSLAAHELASRGLSTCGTAENPCTLQPLQVTTPAAGTFAAAKRAAQAAPMVLRAASVTTAQATPTAPAES
jgi:hypothetical protein